MQEILIISNYYPPEKGAAANRIEQLALKLNEHSYKVQVVCPLPNYPQGKIFKSYQGRFTVNETLLGIAVKRLWIYPSNSKNKFIRIFSTASFLMSLGFYLIFSRTPQKVVIQSPPLLLSFIAVFLLSLQRKKIILNVSDLWPLAAIELGVLRPYSFSHKLSLFMERFIYSNATVILGQSEEIISHVQSITHKKNNFLYRNYPNPFANSTIHNSTIEEPKNIKLFYAGLLGVAQGVFEICKNIEIGRGMELHIFGDGAEKTAIEKYIGENPDKNIFFHGMLDRKVLHQKLSDFDIAFAPLTTRIYGSVPSKIFEYSALGIPILYFGGGEGQDIVRNHNLGWVAEVGNSKDLNKVLQEIAAIGKAEIQQRKSHVASQSKAHFNLEKQVIELINKDVF